MPEDSVLNLKKETKNWIYETILENNQDKLTSTNSASSYRTCRDKHIISPTAPNAQRDPISDWNNPPRYHTNPQFLSCFQQHSSTRHQTNN